MLAGIISQLASEAMQIQIGASHAGAARLSGAPTDDCEAASGFPYGAYVLGQISHLTQGTFHIANDTSFANSSSSSSSHSSSSSGSTDPLMHLLSMLLGPYLSRMLVLILSNDFFSAGIGLFLLSQISTYWQRLLNSVWNLLLVGEEVNIVVEEKNDLYDYLVEFLAENIPPNSTNLIAAAVWRTSDADDWYDEFGHPDKHIQPDIIFTAGSGDHIFTHGEHKIRVVRQRRGERSESNNAAILYAPENISLSVAGRDPTPIKDFLLKATEFSMEKKNKPGFTNVYANLSGRSCWTKMESRPSRTLASVVLKPSIKEMILKDVKRFIASADWYLSNGVPYRRGYILHGPPGTGKTSFIIALAGELKMSVCLLKISNYMDDNSLFELVNRSPRKSIVVIEDIDAAISVACTKNAASTDNAASADGSADDALSMMAKGGSSLAGQQSITLSGLLNSLDGIVGADGRIVFMTTNYVDRLAPALLRPGRCDIRVCLDYCDHSQIRGLFDKFFLPASASFSNLNNNIDDIDDSDDGDDKDDNVSDKFNVSELKMNKSKKRDEKRQALVDIREGLARLIPEGSVTAAEMQHLFMLERDSPENLLTSLPAFLREVAGQRREGKNADTQRRVLMKAAVDAATAAGQVPLSEFDDDASQNKNETNNNHNEKNDENNNNNNNETDVKVEKPNDSDDVQDRDNDSKENSDSSPLTSADLVSSSSSSSESSPSSSSSCSLSSSSSSSSSSSLPENSR